MSAAALLAVEKGGKTFAGAVTALADVSLGVREGEFLSLLGPSGCGKSTLLRAMAGLDPLTEGRVLLHGAPVVAPPPGFGMVFQRDVLLDWRSVMDNVLLAAEFEGRPRRAMEPRALALLERFGLAAFARRYPWELSGGMRQRAGICRALLCEPEVILMDEPFGALDAMTRDDLNGELSRIQQEGRRTVVFVTHSIPEAVFLSDRVAVMSAGPGRVVEMVDIALPRPRPLSLREAPEFGREVARLRAIFTGLGVQKA